VASTLRNAVIKGDIQDTQDADRISALAIPAVQINTGRACHIDGNMIREALPTLNWTESISSFPKTWGFSSAPRSSKSEKTPK